MAKQQISDTHFSTSVSIPLNIIADLLGYFMQQQTGNTMAKGAVVREGLKQFHGLLIQNDFIRNPHTLASAKMYLNPEIKQVDLRIMEEGRVERPQVLNDSDATAEDIMKDLIGLSINKKY